MYTMNNKQEKQFDIEKTKKSVKIIKVSLFITIVFLVLFVFATIMNMIKGLPLEDVNTSAFAAITTSVICSCSALKQYEKQIAEVENKNQKTEEYKTEDQKNRKAGKRYEES